MSDGLPLHSSPVAFRSAILFWTSAFLAVFVRISSVCLDVFFVAVVS